MQTTIEMLYNGKLHPWEELNADKDAYGTACDEMIKIRDCLKGKLNPEMQAELEGILDKESDISIIELEQTFVNGFRLGARLMLDILT